MVYCIIWPWTYDLQNQIIVLHIKTIEIQAFMQQQKNMAALD